MTTSDDGSLLAFDTGLLGKCGKDVFALAEKNDGAVAWCLAGFCEPGEGELCETLASSMQELPGRACYLSDIHDVCLEPCTQVAISWPSVMRDALALGIVPEDATDAEDHILDAVRWSVLRAAASYRIAAPAYDPRTDDVKLLLPYQPLGTDLARAAFVLSRGEGYRVTRVLDLASARACASVVSAEQPDWLSGAPRTLD